jgi:hypothetical protein
MRGAGQHSMRHAGIFQGKHGPNLRKRLPTIEKFRNRAQPGGCHPHVKESCLDAVFYVWRSVSSNLRRFIWPDSPPNRRGPRTIELSLRGPALCRLRGYPF